MSTQNHSDSISPPPISARIWKIAAVTGAGAFIAMLASTVAHLAIELAPAFSRVRCLLCSGLMRITLPIPVFT